MIGLVREFWRFKEIVNDKTAHVHQCGQSCTNRLFGCGSGDVLEWILPSQNVNTCNRKLTTPVGALLMAGALVH